MENTNNSHVRFFPWIGTHYEEGLENGIKVLILGDSHYCIDAPGEQKQKHSCPKDHHHYCDLCYMDIECHLKTQDTIRELLKGNACRAHQVFESMVKKESMSQSDFWNRVAFYEFIQYSQTGPGAPLNHGDRSINKDAFLEVLNYLKPDKIIIWGKSFYRDLGQAFQVHPEFARAFTMTIHNTPVLIMDHPAWRYNKRSDWTSILKSFIESGE